MRSRHLLIALLAICSLLVAACGQARGPGGTTTGEQAEQGGGTEDEGPIKIGASLSLTGDYARIAADQENAYRLFVEQLNEKGGLLGREVELIVLDDRSTPETGARLYERLITEENVDLLMGPYSSAVTGGMMPIAERHQMVNIAPMASADELFEQDLKWSFQVITPASQYLNGALEIMKEEGYKSAAYIGEDSAFPASILSALEAQSGEQGFELVIGELYPVGTTDFSSLLSQIKSKQPDVVLGGTYAQDAIAITGQLQELGVDPKLVALTVGAAENEYWDAVGKTGQHVMGASHWEPALETPGNEEFVKAYKEKFDKEPGYHAAGSYAGMQILTMAVEACECLDQEQIRQQIVDLETETVFGEFDVNETGAQVGKTGVMVQWFDGKKEIIWPFDIATEEYVADIEL